jgi:hypothetical protein
MENSSTFPDALANLAVLSKVDRIPIDMRRSYTVIPVDRASFPINDLDEELRAYVVDGAFGLSFDHPLYRDIHILFTANMPAEQYSDLSWAPAGLARINEIIRRKKKELSDAEAKGDWGSYVFIHHRPYRVDALLNVIRRRGASRLWPLVRHVWTNSESNMQSWFEWSEIWSHAYTRNGNFRRCFRNFMRPVDRRTYDNLPEVITAYRGCADEDEVEGYSWTLDRGRAEWFARRATHRGPGIVATVNVHKSVALAYLSDRQESEIILDIEYLHEDIQVESLGSEQQEAA